jgi:hypothetical protein
MPVVIAALVQPWPLVAAAAAIVVEAKLSSAATYVSLFLFCLIATSSVLVIEIHAVFRPERSHALLARIKAWIDTHRDRVIIIVSVLLGIWLIGKSSYYSLLDRANYWPDPHIESMGSGSPPRRDRRELRRERCLSHGNAGSGSAKGGSGVFDEEQWYVREETLREANTCIVNHHHSLELAGVFGGGTMSSSDVPGSRCAASR